PVLSRNRQRTWLRRLLKNTNRCPDIGSRLSACSTAAESPSKLFLRSVGSVATKIRTDDGSVNITQPQLRESLGRALPRLPSLSPARCDRWRGRSPRAPFRAELAPPPVQARTAPREPSSSAHAFLLRHRAPGATSTTTAVCRRSPPGRRTLQPSDHCASTLELAPPTPLRSSFASYSCPEHPRRRRARQDAVGQAVTLLIGDFNMDLQGGFERGRGVFYDGSPESLPIFMISPGSDVEPKGVAFPLYQQQFSSSNNHKH